MMQAAKISVGLLFSGVLLGYAGAHWQHSFLLVLAGVSMLAGIIASGFTDCRHSKKP
ncbi:hypothetical protein QVN42_01255 [Yersinia nurmii]|uniref:Membrane protein n=1 Tax=Yersinia nurmii TaxID=685706 RepID=A0AAW7K492_9GAMM|nr:hypothetical protein [Yersinia nurmii]MDN0086034.1 hypothetical protein [Yersinia nurmii]CND87354.1 membrane protein [Yersinia nurmii]